MTENNTEILEFIQKQINETQFLLNDELYYQNTKLMPRSEFKEIKIYLMMQKNTTTSLKW
jgi:hypothetical protein